ncbi:MAG: RDD family protein, partial [Chloroflexota bacterium]
VEQSYLQLKKLYAAGSLSAEAFDVQLKEMMVQDDAGRWWAKSRESGVWHYHDGQDWIEAVPPARAEVTAPDPAPDQTADRVEAQPKPADPSVVVGGRDLAPAADAARDDYRRDVALTWIDRRLTRDDVDRLRARAKELGLGSGDTAAIERELLGDVKEVVLLRQVGVASDRSKDAPGRDTEKQTTAPDPPVNGKSTAELSPKVTTSLVTTEKLDRRAPEREPLTDPRAPKQDAKAPTVDPTKQSTKPPDGDPTPKVEILPKPVREDKSALDFATIGGRSLAFLIDCAIFLGLFVVLEIVGLTLDAVPSTIANIIGVIGIFPPLVVVVVLIVIGVSMKDQLDDILSFVIGVVVLLIVELIGEAVFGSRDAFDVVLIGLIVCGYFIYFGATTGQTFGMKSQRIKVVRLDQRPLTLENGVMRCLGGIMCVLTAGIGFFVASSDSNRQGWHDRAAGTTVVKAGP